MALPSHTQLMLPLLQTLKNKGGTARPRDLYDETADQFNLSDEDRNSTASIGARKVNAFERRLRCVFGLRSEDDLSPLCPSKTMVFRHLPRSSTNCPLPLERLLRHLVVCARRIGRQLQADHRARCPEISHLHSSGVGRSTRPSDCRRA